MILHRDVPSSEAFNLDKVATRYGYQIELDAWSIVVKLPCGAVSSDRLEKELIAPLAYKLDKLAESERKHFLSHEPRRKA